MMKRSLGRRSRSYWGIRVALVVIAVAMRAATSAAQEESPAADVMRRFGLDQDQIAQVHRVYMERVHWEAAEGGPHKFAKFHKTRDWVNLIMSLVCVTCAACAAGLTLGLVSLDPLDLQLKIRAGTEKQQKWAKKVLPLVERHHLMLVTLLLFNATANEALPIFLDSLVPTYAAVIISVTMVLIFGEIVPSAIMTGPRQLQLAAMLSGLTWSLIVLFFPIAYPLSLVLDHVLGHEPMRIYTRTELAALMNVQQDLHDDGRLDSFSGTQSTVKERNMLSNMLSRKSTGGLRDGGDVESGTAAANQRTFTGTKRDAPLTEAEALMVMGILENTHETAENVMVGLDKMYSLDRETKLTMEVRKQLFSAGHSRVLVHADGDKANVRGFFHVKRLITMCTEDKIAIKNLALFRPLVVDRHCALVHLLHLFKDGRAHMAVISDDPEATMRAWEENRPLLGTARAIGIATMEDVLEELLQHEIMDEVDHLRNKCEILYHKTIVSPQTSREILRCTELGHRDEQPSNVRRNSRELSASSLQREIELANRMERAGSGLGAEGASQL